MWLSLGISSNRHIGCRTRFIVCQVNGSISFHDEDFFQVTQDLDSFTQMVSGVIFSEILTMLDACICHTGHHCFWRFGGRL